MKDNHIWLQDGDQLRLEYIHWQTAKEPYFRSYCCRCGAGHRWYLRFKDDALYMESTRIKPYEFFFKALIRYCIDRLIKTRSLKWQY